MTIAAQSIIREYGSSAAHDEIEDYTVLPGLGVGLDGRVVVEAAQVEPGAHRFASVKMVPSASACSSAESSPVGSGSPLRV